MSGYLNKLLVMPQLKKTRTGLLKDYLLITIGSFLYAAGVSLFFDPNNIATGGVTGISILINRLTGIEIGTMVLLINIPIMILGIWKFGFRFILSTIYSLVIISISMNLLAPLGALTKEPVLAALAGSALTGGSMGIVFKAGATTGGTDIIVKVIRLRYPYLKTGSVFLIMDAAIIVMSYFVFSNMDSALYSGIAIIVSMFVMDLVLYGKDEARMIFIISDSSEKVADRLMEELRVGVTYLGGEGAYEKKTKKVILCVCRKNLAPKVEEIVKETDSMSFLIVSSANEIYGYGYKSYFSEKY